MEGKMQGSTLGSAGLQLLPVTHPQPRTEGNFGIPGHKVGGGGLRMLSTSVKPSPLEIGCIMFALASKLHTDTGHIGHKFNEV